MQPPAHVKQNRDLYIGGIQMTVVFYGRAGIWLPQEISQGLTLMLQCWRRAGSRGDSQLRHGRAASGTTADPGASAPTSPPCTRLLSTPQSRAALGACPSSSMGAVRASHCCHMHLSKVTSEP